MTKLITFPKFAGTTGLAYRLCLQSVGSGAIPWICVGRRRRIDMRWVEQGLPGGYRPSEQELEHRSSLIFDLTNCGREELRGLAEVHQREAARRHHRGNAAWAFNGSPV